MKKTLCIILVVTISNLFGIIHPVDSPTLQPGVFSIIAKHKNETFECFSGSHKNILIVASEDNASTGNPEGTVDYNMNPIFGKGTKVGKGFVVYKGEAGKIKVDGLRPNKKYFFTIYEMDANGFYKICDTPITNDNSEEKSVGAIVAPAAVVVCVCPPIAGVTCSITGTTNTGTSVASAAGCPHVGYCDGPGTNNPWSSAAGTGTLQYLFSAPVSAATLRANSVNTNDYATVSASGGTGGVLSISGVVCMGVSGLVIGPMSVASSYGGVSWTVNSTGTYTRVLLVNTGAQSGWVATCPTAITAVLPIELASLKGICTGNKIKLEWQTLSEKNNSYFTVERSYNTESWEVIGQVPGAGNSTSLRKYDFTDNSPMNALAYYRLKQTDFDKEFKYSELITVENCEGKNEMTVYPNPASREVFVKVKEDVQLEIYNVLGKISASINLKAGENKIDVSNFTNGTYFFKLTGADSGLKFTKVLVNN